jgi:arsenate reductase (glutaredoxin)
MNITVFGIKNCDTMKKSFDWLNDHKVKYTFHDYRVSGITKEQVEVWFDKLPVNEVINTRSTTFKELSETQQKSVSNRQKAIGLVLANPTMVKRPLIMFEDKIVTGYKPDIWQSLL